MEYLYYSRMAHLFNTLEMFLILLLCVDGNGDGVALWSTGHYARMMRVTPEDAADVLDGLHNRGVVTVIPGGENIIKESENPADIVLLEGFRNSGLMSKPMDGKTDNEIERVAAGYRVMEVA